MQEHPISPPPGQKRAAPPAPRSPLGYSPAEAAKILGKHKNTIRAWMTEDGPLAGARRIGSLYYIPRRAVLALLDLEDHEASDLVAAQGGDVA
ncbi:MAG TPA: helix-turn-helix domain-containing protein [Streptosporangiaceae bacterium]|jgi:excisionase family DNA binding protein